MADEQHRILSKRFLEQVHLQTLAEAVAAGVGQVEWFYSVPTSFSPNQKAFASAQWKRLTGPASQPSERTESLATAAYFYDRLKAPMAAGTVCIDVGGMSADVAVWQENEVRLQTSLRLASRAILVGSLEGLPDVQEALLGRSGMSGAEIETELSRRKSELFEAVAAKENVPGVRRVRQLIAFGFGGLLYYTGLLLRHLASKGLYREQLPHAYVGGNGARMLDWLAYGDFDGSSPINALFKAVMAEATGFAEGAFGVTVTGDAEMKHEVGYGLVTDHFLAGAIETVALAGEEFTLAGERMEWDVPLEPTTYARGVEAAPALPQLHRYVNAFNAYAGTPRSAVDPVPTSKEIWYAVADRVRQHVTDLRSRDAQDVDPEPLFATGLKAYLDVLRSQGLAG